MWLEMHIAALFIDRVWLDYSGFETVAERQQYQERIAEELYFKHNRAIKQMMEDPEFFIQAESKMNHPNFLPGMWEDLINEHGSPEAKIRSAAIATELRTDSAVVDRITQVRRAHIAKRPTKPPEKKETKPDEKFVRPTGGYSNIQWNDITAEELDKKNE